MTYIPQSSHGGVPSGWNQTAATGEVVAKSTTDAGIPVHIEGIAGQDPAGDWTLFQVDDANAAIRFDIESNGTVSMVPVPADAGKVSIVETSHSTGIEVTDDLAGAHRFAFVLRKITNAPDDTVLAAGDMALWLDPTNGAAKLMVKAKQNDGTVKSAAVALS